jgi:hypothetical protein
VLLGADQVTLNFVALVTDPPEVTALIFPVLAPAGTLTFSLEAVSFVTAEPGGDLINRGQHFPLGDKLRFRPFEALPIDKFSLLTFVPA